MLTTKHCLNTLRRYSYTCAVIMLCLLSGCDTAQSSPPDPDQLPWTCEKCRHKNDASRLTCEECTSKERRDREAKRKEAEKKEAEKEEEVEEVECPICCELKSDTLKCANCRKIFCKKCVEDWLNRSDGTCPLCFTKNWRESLVKP